MNLQEHIHRILKEETNAKINVRRRLAMVDDEFNRLVRDHYTPNNICGYSDGEELLDAICHAVCESMYWDHFQHIDDGSNDWSVMYLYIIEYLNDKYEDKINEYYHINCGN